MTDISRRVIGQLGLDNSTFSIEFFHDPDTGRINLLEINSRHSQSHAALFEYVDGAPNHHAMLRLALGCNPRFGQRQGRYRIAAEWHHRRFADGIVRAVPDAEQIERINTDIPGVAIYPVPHAVGQLSGHVGGFLGAEPFGQHTERGPRGTLGLGLVDVLSALAHRREELVALHRCLHFPCLSVRLRPPVWRRLP